MQLHARNQHIYKFSCPAGSPWALASRADGPKFGQTELLLGSCPGHRVCLTTKEKSTMTRDLRRDPGGAINASRFIDSQGMPRGRSTGLPHGRERLSRFPDEWKEA